MARFQRKDLKRPDRFVTTTRSAIDWASHNRRQVGVVAGVIIAAGLTIAGVAATRSARVRQANEELAQGLNQLHSEKYVEAAVQLNDTGMRWDGTNAGAVALLYSSQANLLAKNSDGAAAAAQKVVDEGDAPAYLLQQAWMTLAFVSEDKGDFGKAAEQYGKARAIEGPYSSSALLGEARARERLGERDKAAQLFQSFVDEYPESKDQTYAAARLAELKAS
ncbi:MAG TPA: tetratricopeptide repeat protein [Terriglobales bacterium]|nr:tetratricopeptide repeat protein [Terriglobales bacterium]